MNLYHPETLKDYGFDLEATAVSPADKKKLLEIQATFAASFAKGIPYDSDAGKPQHVFTVNKNNELVEVSKKTVPAATLSPFS